MPNLITLTIVDFTPVELDFRGNDICEGQIKVEIGLIPTDIVLPRFQLILEILPVPFGADRFLFSNNKSSISGIYTKLKNGDTITKDVSIKLRSNSTDEPSLLIRAGGRDLVDPTSLINTNTQEWSYLI